MNTKKNEFLIGLTMSVATLIVIVGILVLGKSNFFVPGLSINLIVDNANGIGQGDEVYYRGLKVGSVSDAGIINDQAAIKLKISGIDNIPVDSRFEIKDYSLIGGKVVEITSGTAKTFLKKNAVVRGVSSASGLGSLISDVKKLEPKIIRILDNLDTLTGDETQKNIELILKELLETITSTKKVVKVDLHNTLNNLSEITSENKGNISELIKSLSKSSDSLSEFLNKSSSAAVKLDSLLANLNEGKGSAGNLLKSDSLYQNLNRAITSIDSLVSDIKKNPKKYIDVSVF
ncbi:MAG: MCE family protein [Chlorobi bacterium]|nr:MCE family protein [Chlorobiota bacterium]